MKKLCVKNCEKENRVNDKLNEWKEKLEVEGKQ